ncbi:septum site-determining protein MinC [Butyrivibrio sp. CB08]|nr:septum site-determining protein MinC [Butyrivibrio sp. CB08]
MGLLIRGRDLSDAETDEVVRIIEKNSDLTISCIIDEESDLERVFARKMGKEEQPVIAGEVVSQAIEGITEDTALIYKGNLRSGQDISSEKSIVILGDVKPGANVTSFGSIFILGELRGNAFAGASGDRKSVIMALELDPIQIRIAETIAISPDAEKGNKIKVKRKKLLKDAGNVPEVAYIENGHIVKTSYGTSFLRQFYKI